MVRQRMTLIFLFFKAVLLFIFVLRLKSFVEASVVIFFLFSAVKISNITFKALCSFFFIFVCFHSFQRSSDVFGNFNFLLPFGAFLPIFAMMMLLFLEGLRLLRHIFLLESGFVFGVSQGEWVLDPVFVVNVFYIPHDERVVMGREEGSVGSVGVPCQNRKVVLKNCVNLVFESGGGTLLGGLSWEGRILACRGG